MSIIVQNPPSGQDLITLPGAEICETRPYSTRICFQARYSGSKITFWHTAWFPTRSCAKDPVRVEAAMIMQALNDLATRNGHKYEAVTEDLGQKPGDAR